MNTRISKYWICQMLGWGLFILINLFFAFNTDRLNKQLTGRLLVFVALGFLVSHIMRYVIIRSDILRKPLKRQLIGFVLITMTFAFVTGLADTLLLYFLKLETRQEIKSANYVNFLGNALSSFFYLFIWNCIYFSYHYIQKSRNQQLDTLKLEALVKELELKTIKSHINPHFIFNALNSIRALIDENPSRARDAITELSNILRSSMQAEKMETVPFERELSIVKDYLALEHIRFEDRLNVEYEIDKKTLNQPVPPMMLQTLVENAIKHGISKQVSGGTVRIVSNFKGSFHQMLILNTGRLSGIPNSEGFGLPGTRSRLYLMFGDKAVFNIREVNGSMVEATVQIPLL